jgi:hypothetical protein
MYYPWKLNRFENKYIYELTSKESKHNAEPIVVMASIAP